MENLENPKMFYGKNYEIYKDNYFNKLNEEDKK